MKVTETQNRWLKRAARLFLSGLLSLVLLSCASKSQSVRLLDLPDVPSGDQVRSLSGSISEVAPPAIFLDLANLMDSEPQVAIAQPKPDQVIEETSLSAQLTLRGLSIYKDEKTGLGPHLQVTLDNQPAQSIYSLDDPLEFSDLSPGSHTLRVLAVRPWGESFKNEAAFAQTTFHVFAKTGANAPDLDQPLLTYSEPQGTYGAEPILLDFYLTNAPLHMIAQESSEDDLSDWRVRCTVNGQSFLFEQWQPIYLKGFKPGQNWVQLTLVDEQGDPIENAFNSTVRLVNYDPEQQDSLAKIVRGDLPLKQIGQIADPDYEPPAEPVVLPAPIDEPVEGQPDEPVIEPLPLTGEQPELDNETEPELDREAESGVEPETEFEPEIEREPKQTAIEEEEPKADIKALPDDRTEMIEPELAPDEDDLPLAPDSLPERLEMPDEDISDESSELPAASELPATDESDSAADPLPLDPSPSDPLSPDLAPADPGA